MDFEEVMKQMRVKYLADLKPKIEDLKIMAAQKDYEGLESFFHKLKGSGTSYGLPQFTEYGAKYELKAKKKELTDEDYKAIPKDFEALF
jgi:HPt (histidine-containing phosphotransfer) domain-containing protein